MSVRIRRTSKLVQVADLIAAIHEAESLVQRLQSRGKETEAQELEHLNETVVSIAALFLRHRFAALNLQQYGAFTQLQDFINKQQNQLVNSRKD
jgi:ATP sulfurylase